MNCPYCNQQMKHGRILTDHNGIVFEQKFVADGTPPETRWQKVQKTISGVFAPVQNNIRNCTDAYLCENCRKVIGIFDYDADTGNDFSSI